MTRILCVYHEPSVAVMLEESLKRAGSDCLLVDSAPVALTLLEQQSFDLIICGSHPSRAGAFELLDQLQRAENDIPVIVVSGDPNVHEAVLSMRHGAADYLGLPIQFESLRAAVSSALETCKLRSGGEWLTKFRAGGGHAAGAIVGCGDGLRRALEIVNSVAPTSASVLIEGESGTGKELIARLIHRQSKRRNKPFVAINCAAVPEGLIESTLFGHERGAFTGAAARYLGALERANGGTLLLDEISEMRLDLQAKFLRVLQEKEFERVGGSQTVRVDVRIIATTNRHLPDEVNAGRFRADLYYRLNVVPIHTVPLRENRGDIPVLVEHFVREASVALGFETPEVAPETIELLGRRNWPGNVRELANAVERAVILCKTGRLEPGAFDAQGRVALEPLSAGMGRGGTSPVGGAGGVSTALTSPSPASGADSEPDDATFDLRKIERFTIERALAATGGHRTRAAELLGISERTLRNKLNGPSHERREQAEAWPACGAVYNAA